MVCPLKQRKIRKAPWGIVRNSNDESQDSTINYEHYDGRLIELQQMCHTFGKKYTMETAVEFLRKFNIHTTKEILQVKYDTKELTLISYLL